MPPLVAVVVELGVLGGSAVVRRETVFDRLRRLNEELPNRYLAVMILVQLRRLPPGNLGECLGKLGVVKLLVRGRGGDHDATRPGEGRQKPARSRGREPEDLLATCDAIKQPASSSSRRSGPGRWKKPCSPLKFACPRKNTQSRPSGASVRRLFATASVIAWREAGPAPEQSPRARQKVPRRHRRETEVNQSTTAAMSLPSDERALVLVVAR